MPLRRLLVLLSACAVAAGCGAAHRTGGNAGSGGTGGGSGGSGGAGGSGGSGGGGGSGGSTGGSSFAEMCPAGQKTTIDGTIVAPNGHDPVPNAFAYVPIDVDPIPGGVACELCNQPFGGSEVSVISDVGGKFSLDISKLSPSATVNLTVDKGRFRRTTEVTITPCMSNAVSAPATQLPSKTGTHDDIPKIAVATGNRDELDVVLVAMGLDATAGFDCYEGRATTPSKETVTSPCITRKGTGTLTPVETLLADATMLAQYNLVFLACAPGKYLALQKADAQQVQTIVANLQAWTGKGGRLFVTDGSYDYVAQAFPSEITFVGGNSTVDAANMGVGGTSAMPDSYSGTINDPTLASWLATAGVLPAGTTTLSLGGYLDPWSVIASVPTTTADIVDATNAVAYTTPPSTSGGKPTNPGAPMSYPQTVRFDVAPAGSTSACGRVIYTSYHTLPTTMTGSTLAPQESILEYLMFEATSCLGAIG